MTESRQWRRCSACKNPIEVSATYWICSVSTCNRKRTGLAFCSVSCWEVHLPGANHRQAWALERTAPSAPGDGSEEAKPGQRRIVRSAPSKTPGSEKPSEVLIVASRLKDYIRARSGYKTSEGVLSPLSDIVRRVCDDAIENARREGRMTVLDRDVPTTF